MKSIALILFFLSSNLFGQDTLNTSQVDINGCINLYNSSIIIQNRDSLDSHIRKDASNEYCQEFLKDLGMDNSSILGINLNSGYCRIPAGLTFDVVKMERKKKYTVFISYTETLTPCCALSSYNLWIKVPSIPDNYEVNFVITPLPYQE